MKVKIAFTVDIDIDAYQQRFWPLADCERCGAFIRDEVQGSAASAVVHGLLGGRVIEGGVLNDYHVAVWDSEDAQAPTGSGD